MRLSDVAEHAGVALNTARKALCDDPTVRPYIKERVLKAAQDLDYHPNLLARALKEKSLRLIPIAIPELHNPYFGSLATEISKSLIEASFEPALCFNSQHLVLTSRSLATSGSILAYGFDEQVVRTLAKRQKVVTIDSPLPDIRHVANVAVGMDDVYRRATTLLLGRGRRRLALYSAFYRQALEHHWPEPKLTAVMATLRDSGLAPVGPGSDPIFDTPPALGAWLAAHPASVDAIVCGTDLEAAHVMRLLAQLGVRVPEDVQVIGCDANCVLSGMWSVRIDTSVLAKEVLGLLCRLLDGETHVESRSYVPTLVDDQGLPVRA